jgi:hypothetical protein
MVVANAALTTSIVVGTALMSFVSPANAVTYSTSGAPTQIKLGDTIGSNYDKLIINGVTGTFSSDPSTIVLNTLDFIAGFNATVPQAYTGVFSFAETMTIGTGSGTLVVPFNLSISYSDTLTIIGGTTLSLFDGTNTWQVVVNGLTIGPNPVGEMIANLTALVTDPPTLSQAPLPAALPLFAIGLGAMGLFGWRRKRKNAAI